jgi:hypothetical protein
MGGPFLPYAGGPQKSHPEVAEVNIYRKGILYYPGAIYFLFGYTYVSYATFIVTTLVRKRGFPESLAGNFWMRVGFLSRISRSNAPDLFRPDRPSRPVGRLRGHFASMKTSPQVAG